LNIVFDLGGVVVLWQPDQIIRATFEDKRTREKVKLEIFEHPDWLDLDRGVLDTSEAIERAAVRTKLPDAMIRELFHQIPPSLTPVFETINLIRSVKRNGHKVFALSNIHLASIEYIERMYSFLDLFDGIVISSRIQKVKPDAEIFEYLLNKYGLVAEETIFIDDTEANLMGAVKLGIQPIRFETPDQCEEELKRMGCI
jgi:putative hydrolase of the HAD superfamily